MKRVVIESPFAGNIELNITYGRFAMHDCLVNHNESPYASHLLYTQEYVLRDEVPEDRKLGIEAGFYWRDVADKTVFYVDLGLTDGMELGIIDCVEKQKTHEIRNISTELFDKLVKICIEKDWGHPMLQKEHREKVIEEIKNKKLKGWLE